MMLEMPGLQDVCRRELYTESVASPREKCAAVNTTGRSGRSKEPSKSFDIRHGAIDLEFVLLGFLSCFASSL